jgi:hypothetical protein
MNAASDPRTRTRRRRIALATRAASAAERVLEPLRNPSRAPVEPVQQGAVRLLCSAAAGVRQSARSSRAGTRRAASAATEAFWKARQHWALRRRGLAPYLVSIAVAVVVGWLVSAH